MTVRIKFPDSDVVLSHIYPPIPDRRWDWCAYHDGEEESGHYGYGRTQQEAIADLERLDQERAEWREEEAAKQQEFPL